MLLSMVIDGMDVPESGEAVDGVADLLEAVATGDERAFADLFDQLSSRVFGLIVRVLVDRSQSEEVLQEVFLEIWQRAASFERGRGQARSWILTIAHRRAVDRVRSSQASADRDRAGGIRDLDVPFDSTAETVADGIEARRLAAALATLPPPQQEAIVLAYYGGYSQSEIAVLTRTPLGTVKTRMRDGMNRLRGILGRQA